VTYIQRKNSSRGSTSVPRERHFKSIILRFGHITTPAINNDSPSTLTRTPPAISSDPAPSQTRSRIFTPASSLACRASRCEQRLDQRLVSLTSSQPCPARFELRNETHAARNTKHQAGNQRHRRKDGGPNHANILSLSAK
jgi:hypothetical protein